MSDPGVVGLLNRLTPGARHAHLGDRLQELIDYVREATRVMQPFNVGPAGLAIGVGSKAKVLIANTVNYQIDGKWYQKTTAEIAFTATTHDITASASSTRAAIYLLSINSAGTVTITKGTEAATVAACSPPATPADECPLGYVGIQIAAGVTSFDASSDLLDAGHITDTYVDLCFNPVGDVANPFTLTADTPTAIG